MPKPFTNLTGNGCHFHMSLWDGDTNLFLDENDPRGLGLSETAYQLHRRAEEAREGLQRDHGADGQLLQAAQGRLDGERRDLVARLDLVRLQQPHADAPHPRARKGRGPHDRRQLQPLSRGDRHPRRGPRRNRVRGSTRAIPTARTSTRSHTTELRSRGLETLPSNLLDATEELEGDEALRSAFGRGRDEDYVDYFIRVKRDEWARYHEQVTPWEVREYLTRF